MSEERAVFIDGELMAQGISACHELFQQTPRDFVTVSLGVADMLGMPVYDLRSCLRSWYTIVGDAMEASSVPVPDASTSAEIDEALVWLNRWMPSLPRTRPFAFNVIGPTPDTVSLREMMATALSHPTPDAVMDFASNVVRQNRFGPYNILMIYAQRPGAGMVANRGKWQEMGRDVRDGAIPILILHPNGPITQVFEELDVVPPLPRSPDSDAFSVTGQFDAARLHKLVAALAAPGNRKMMVKVRGTNIGRNLAGWITAGSDPRSASPPRVEPLPREEQKTGLRAWEVAINEKHSPAEQFVTLLHELGHLFCGHLGEFKPANLRMDESGWPDRRALQTQVKEIEAELVAWWLADREGLTTGSPHYLRPYMEFVGPAVAEVDLDRVTRAVARIRSYIGDRR